MQKKIIALAVAGLVSGAAFAQTNVTVYGIADVAWEYYGKAQGDLKSTNKISDGGQDASRVGFKGTEDLGNGLSAFFQLEQRFNLDQGVNTAGTQRNSNVGLTGKSWGTVKLGSFGHPLDDYNGYSEAGGMGYGNGVIDQITISDVKNGIEYISPNMSGLEAKVGYSTSMVTEDPTIQFKGAGDDGNDFQAVKAYFASLAYANGPIKAALVYDHEKPANQDFNNMKSNEWLINGSYNFGPVAVGAGYDQYKATDGGEWLKRKAWRINVGAPVTANDTVALSYSQAKYTASVVEGSYKAKGWGVSYSHAMSKRTNIYATYGKMSQDDELDETVFSNAFGASEDTDNLGYESSFKVGMRHFF